MIWRHAESLSDYYYNVGIIGTESLVVFTEITRRQAFVAHLLISTGIFAVLLYLIVFHWYPSFYLYIDGGYRGLAILFVAGIVLGPGLTLLVFRQGKARLTFTVSAIVAIQSLALVWATWWIYSERPALTVFYDGEFFCMKQSEVPKAQLRRLATTDAGLLLAVLPRPNTYSEYQHMLAEALRRNSASIYVFSEKFLPMDAIGTVQLMHYTLDVAESLSGNHDQIVRYTEIWNDYIEHRSEGSENHLYFPLSCRYGRVLAVFDPEASMIVDYLPIVTTRANSNIELGFSREEIQRYRDRLDRIE